MSIFNIFNKQATPVSAQVCTTPTTPSTPLIYEGKWGYYPVSRETFLKLKELHKWYHETLRNLGTWVRWTRKKVHKVGPEPKYCHTFVIDKYEVRKHVNKKGLTEWRWYPKTRNDCGIREAYQIARMPKKTSEEVVQLKISETEINKLYSEVSKFFNK